MQQTLRAGQLPPYEVVQLGEAIRPYTRPGDVILSTHELIWEFHQPGDQLYSVNAESEIFGPQSLQVDNAEAIWRHIAPTVIVYIQSRMSITPSLQRYMDETGFQACTQFDAVGDAVTIYRVNC